MDIYEAAQYIVWAHPDESCIPMSKKFREALESFRDNHVFTVLNPTVNIGVLKRRAEVFLTDHPKTIAQEYLDSVGAWREAGYRRSRAGRALAEITDARPPHMTAQLIERARRILNEDVLTFPTDAPTGTTFAVTHTHEHIHQRFTPPTGPARPKVAYFRSDSRYFHADGQPKSQYTLAKELLAMARMHEMGCKDHFMLYDNSRELRRAVRAFLNDEGASLASPVIRYAVNEAQLVVDLHEGELC